MASLNGRVGQVLGPFPAGQDLLGEGGAISEFTPEVTRPVLIKLGIQTEPGVNVQINDVNVKIGKTGVYELDGLVAVKSLIFPNGASADTQVDFVY